VILPLNLLQGAFFLFPEWSKGLFSVWHGDVELRALWLVRKFSTISGTPPALSRVGYFWHKVSHYGGAGQDRDPPMYASLNRMTGTCHHSSSLVEEGPSNFFPSKSERYDPPDGHFPSNED
jgi:hypothetical protein